jgi:RNA binding exosome subunit
MAKQRPVQHLEIKTLVHGTEDHVKVVHAVSNLFPEDIEMPPYEEVKFTGVFGETISMLKWVLKNRRPSTETLNKVILGLNSLDLQHVQESLGDRIDESKNIYLRVDKQKAATGVIRLDNRDAIRVKARMLVPHKADPVKLMYDHIQELTEDA